MARLSSTFYRLEKDLGNGYKRVYEFHTVVNGNRYYRWYEELPNGGHGYDNGKTYKVFDKERGNNEYRKLKAEGYKFTGEYEMDIFGHRERRTGK